MHSFSATGLAYRAEDLKRSIYIYNSVYSYTLVSKDSHYRNSNTIGLLRAGPFPNLHASPKAQS